MLIKLALRMAPGSKPIVLAMTFLAVASHASAHPGRVSDTPPQFQPVIIEHVTVVPMTEDGALLRDATVVVDKGRIISLDGSQSPRGAKRINGKGKWLIPGLMDMHVHLPSDDYLPDPPAARDQPPRVIFDTQDIMTPYVANGVTLIMNMDANSVAIARRNEIEHGRVIGPTMMLAGLIDGNRPDGRVAITPEDGRQAVRDVKAEGYGFIKLYWRLDADTFTAINDEAKKQGMKVLGHIPDSFQGKLDQAFVPGFGMVAHAEEFSKHSEDFTDADAARFAAMAKSNGTWVTGTLTTVDWIASQVRSMDEIKSSPNLKYMHPVLLGQWLNRNSYSEMSSPKHIAYFDRMNEFHLRLVRAFKDAGVPVVTGTDALNPGVVPGFSMHDELQLLIEAGFTSEEALAAATRLPATWLGIEADRGTIEVGKRADLVLLDADPLADIANTRKISGVLLNGRWLGRRKLDAMLLDLARWNADNKERYDTSSKQAP